MWDIGLKTEFKNFVDTTTHQYIRFTGLISNQFKYDKAQILYKQISCQSGTFYADYLKLVVKSVRPFIGRTFYTNKLVFKKFLPCSNETSA